MRTAKLLTFALAMILAACSSGPQVNTNYDPGTDFSKYKSFTMQKGAAAADSIATQMLDRAIAGALQARGFTRLDSGGDLNLYDHFILGKDTQLNTYGYGGWGGRWGGGMQTTQVQEIPTGTLVVDLVDTKNNTLVWRATAKDELSAKATPEERQQKANDVAAQIFANFPPGSGARK